MFIFDSFRKNDKKRVIETLPGWFCPSQYLLSGDGRTAAVVDERRKLLCLVNENNHYAFFKANKILDFGLVIKDEKYLKQSFWSSALGYMAGRMIDKKGGLQIVGGLFPRLKFQDKVKSIHLTLRLNDFQHPYFSILIYEKGFFSNLKSAENTARHWEGLMMILKNRR